MGITDGRNKKVSSEEKELTDEDFTFSRQKEYMELFIKDSMKNGKSVNEILDMPYSFVLDIFAEQAEKEKEVIQETSLIAAFGG